MIIKCTYANVDEVITRFNGTFEEAQIYYLNKLFNLGTTSDNIQKCIDVKWDEEEQSEPEQSGVMRQRRSQAPPQKLGRF
jgi:hypothetical protein